MNISESQANIGAAFEVVRQTNRNLATFFKELDVIAGKNGYSSIIPSSPGFLRYKSDVDPWGWMVSNFIKLYRKNSSGDQASEESALSSSIFGIEVDFEGMNGPIVRVIHYEYGENGGMGSTIPVSAHWLFYWPLRSKEDFTIVATKPGSTPSTAIPKSSSVIAKYRGLTKVAWKSRDLVEIKQPDVLDLIKGFDGPW